MLNASRHQIGPDTDARDAERAREWTVSCLDAANQPVRCPFVQAICLKQTAPVIEQTQ